jgi:hypothetical protein
MLLLSITSLLDYLAYSWCWLQESLHAVGATITVEDYHARY